MKKLPLEIADGIGISRDMIYRINKGLRKPSPSLTKKIIEVMKERGEPITLQDIRPDWADLVA
jgi:hypothetical protein